MKKFSGHYLHLGDIPRHISNRFNGFKKYPFNGCIKSLYINSSPIDLWSETHEIKNIQSCHQNAEEGIFFDSLDNLNINTNDTNEISLTFEATIERSDVDDILIMMAEGIYEKIFQLRLKFDEVCSSFIEFGLRARLEDLCPKKLHYVIAVYQSYKQSIFVSFPAEN